MNCAALDRLRADAGDRLAHGRLAEALADRQQVDQAIQLLAASADRGDRLAAEHLADLLIRHGRTDQLPGTSQRRRRRRQRSNSS